MILVKSKSTATKLLLAGALAIIPTASATPALAAPVSQSIAPDKVKSAIAGEYGQYLREKFGVSISAAASQGEFISALADTLALKPTDVSVVFKDLSASSPYFNDAKALFQAGILTSDSAQATSRLTALNALQIAVKAAGLQELAATYSPEKANKAVAKLKQKNGAFGKEASRSIAAAIDTGLLPSSYYSDLKPNSPASGELATVLVGQVLSFKGLYKQYLGYSSDPDIYAKLTDAYRSSDILRIPELLDVVDEALERDLVTGYNIKDARYDSRFVDSLSLVYGHSDLKHAIQLIGLLRSEGIDAKVQFEPKTSAFVYLKEWGDPGTSDLYEVRQIANGNYIEYAKEYDIAFEFNKTADKEKFNSVILAYAKKDADDEAGLIAGSWWQPLYYSLTQPKGGGYKLITNNKIAKGHYYAQSFSLKDKSAAVVSGFKKVDPNVTVETYDFWADDPFYRYLNGEST